MGLAGGSAAPHRAVGHAGALRGWDPGPHGGAGAALSQQGWPMPLPVPCPAEPPVCTPQVPTPPQTPSPRGPPPFRFEEKWTDSLRSPPKLVKTFCDRQKSTAQHPLPPAPNLGATGKESEAVCRYTLRPAHEWVITQMTLMVGFGVYLTLLAMVRAIPPVHPPSMLNPVSEEELEFSAE